MFAILHTRASINLSEHYPDRMRPQCVTDVCEDDMQRIRRDPAPRLDFTIAEEIPIGYSERLGFEDRLRRYAARYGSSSFR